jgi:glycosyltransferase involved in cell wall biosynthesis
VTTGGGDLQVIQAVRSDAFAGVERYLSYVAPELARRGHEVVVIGGDPERMARALEPAGVAHRPAATTPEVLRLLARAPKADVVHVHMTAAEVAAAISKPVRRTPIVSTLHFAGPRGRGGPKAVAYRLIVPVLDKEIAISRYVAETSGRRAEVIPHGVPDPRSMLDDRVRAREHVVLMAQRLQPEKGASNAIRAWKASGLDSLGWTLSLAGSGAEEPAIRDLVERLELSSSVDLLGQVDDLPERMARASVFVATTPIEAFGLSVAEAMASGLPIVAADGGGHRELLEHTGGDQLVDCRDVEAFAKALLTLADSATRRDELGQANRRRYEQEYTVEHHVDRLEAVYRSVLGGRR